MQKIIILLHCLLFIICILNAQNRKIIDVHFHARSIGDYGPSTPANPVTGKIPPAKTNDDIVTNNLAALKKNHIVKAICSGTINRNNAFAILAPDIIISALEYPDHQNNPLPDTTLFKQQFEEKKFSIFGELGLQYEGKVLTDSVFEPYLAICERLGIPVGLHTGEAAPNTAYTCCPGFTIAAGKPLLIEPVLKKHPHLKLQLMHMGFPFLEDTKALLNMYPQVYADISAIDWLVPLQEFHNYLKALMIAGFGKRLMYGSDQMAWEDAISLSIKNVEQASFLSESEKQDIFYNNAARFYNIK
jgi:hypothetical protein